MQNIINNIPCARIQPSPIHGQGLFASAMLPAECSLCRLDGQKVAWSIYADWVPPAEAPFIEWNALSEEMLLVRMFRTKYSFINHSRQPNCCVRFTQDGLAVVPLRDIRIGEELTLDYREEPLPPAYRATHGATYL